MTQTNLKNSITEKKMVSLLGLMFFLISVVVYGFIDTQRIPKDEYAEMKSAAERMQLVLKTIQSTIKDTIHEQNGETDPLYSRLIGVEFSPITTTLGNLEAKQSALNPDFAALMVSWLKKCGVNKNDYIAIQASASFPALTFASIIACETLKLKPFISVSLGASSYGANLPEFTFLDMEKILVDSAAIMDKSSLVTPGGTNDNGSSMWPGAVEILLRSVQRNGKSLFTPKTLHESIEKKWNFFNNAGDIRVFINIGGNHASLGNGQCALRIQSGLIDESLHCAQADSDDGLIQKFNHSGIPVIHLLNIRELAARNGIPIIPPRMQPEGESDVYFTKNKPLWLYAISLVIACGVGVYLKI